ncbi:MAG TPA: hypothetical protein VN722_08285 [Hanamia sp.]|nr:hypothetical protein [Hanamia sp.]
MTGHQKYLLKLLLEEGYYLLKTKNLNGVEKYKLYHGNANPVQWINQRTAKCLKEYFKKDKKGIITLNLNLVRQAHGKSNIKTFYKNSKKQSNHGIRSNKSEEKILF